MAQAQFEEKEFEGQLNHQLGSTGAIWTPGQVLEHVIGFDAAIHVNDAIFWAMQGYATPPPGAMPLPEWWHNPALIFPPLSANLFLQHKRPEFLGIGGAEWNAWHSHYYRFRITPLQQVALEQCALGLGNAGVVAYSSPTFHTRAELHMHMSARSLVANTHFAPVRKLSHHSRYTYVTAHQHGKAHSKPKRVKPLKLTERAGSLEFRRSPEALVTLAKSAAKRCVDASPGAVGSKALFEAVFERAKRQLATTSNNTVMSEFLYAATFTRMAGFTWLMR